MRRTIARRWLTVACLLAVAPAAAATQLWQEARLGMTPAEIRTAYPAASEPDTGDAGRGMTPGLVLSDYRVAGNSFNVEFHFEDGGLDRVVLDITGDVSAARELPRDYQTLLEQRYGEPVVYYTEPDPLPLIKAQWVAGERDITLYWVRVRSTEVALRITYSTDMAEAASRL